MNARSPEFERQRMVSSNCPGHFSQNWNRNSQWMSWSNTKPDHPLDTLSTCMLFQSRDNVILCQRHAPLLLYPVISDKRPEHSTSRQLSDNDPLGSGPVSDQLRRRHF